MAAAAPDTPLAHSPAVGVLARDHIERRSSSDFIERGASPLGVVTATLPLGDGPLGLHLNAANVILRISPEGKAAAEGSLKVGMRIVSVNGTSTKGTTLAAIVKASTATALELEAEDSAERRLSIERRASSTAARRSTALASAARRCGHAFGPW